MCRTSLSVLLTNGGVGSTISTISDGKGEGGYAP